MSRLKGETYQGTSAAVHRPEKESHWRLLAAEFIREIYHSEWLANVVMVPKKDKSLRMCIDFKHINRACPKDHFPLPPLRPDSRLDCGM